MCEFTIPDAAFTTVLVAGATGRVGRILVRKLLLRGYTVKVRRRRACQNIAVAAVSPHSMSWQGLGRSR